MNVLDWRGPEFLVLYFVLFFIATIAAFVWRRRLRGPGDDLPPGHVPYDLHPLEVAYLAGGPKSVIDSTIAMLVQRGSLEVKGNKLSASSLAPEDVTPLESAVHRAVLRQKDGRVGPVRRQVADMVRSAAGRLEQLGLVPSDADSAAARLRPALLMLAVLALGILKVGVGINRDRPVVILVVFCLFTFVAAMLFLAIRPTITGRGEQLIARLKSNHAALRTTAGVAPNSLGSSDALLAFALFGPTIFAWGPMSDVRRAVAPPANGGTGCGGGSGCGSGTTSSGSSCGSSSGSSCGGGGGCGGCGGGS